jgi:hypothetical protein
MHDTDVVVPVAVLPVAPLGSVSVDAVQVPLERVRTNGGSPPLVVLYHPPTAHVPGCGHVTDSSTAFWSFPLPADFGSGAFAAVQAPLARVTSRPAP